MERAETKGLSWAAALTVTALLVLVSFIIARMIVNASSGSQVHATLLPCGSSQVIAPLSDGVLYGDSTHLHSLNSAGRQKWNYMVGAGFHFDARSTGVAAWTGSSLTLLNAHSGEPLFSGTMDEPVISAVMGEEYAAVLIGADEQNSTLIIMEHDGREIDEIALTNLTVLDYGFFNTGKMLWVMSLDTEGTVPMSQLTTYRPGRMQSGNITDSDQVLYHVMFDSPNVYTVGTTYAKVYDYTGVEDVSRRMLVYGWYLMDSGGTGENALMAYVPMAQAGSQVTVNDVRMVCGNTDRTVRMPFVCHSLAVAKNKVYGFSQQYIMSYGLNDVSAKITPLPMQCDGMLGVTEANQAILASGESVYLVTLP